MSHRIHQRLSPFTSRATVQNSDMTMQFPSGLPLPFEGVAGGAAMLLFTLPGESRVPVGYRPALELGEGDADAGGVVELFPPFGVVPVAGLAKGMWRPSRLARQAPTKRASVWMVSH